MSNFRSVGFIADCHIGNHRQFGGHCIDGINARGRITLDTFRASLIAARESGCCAVVVAGDLFDHKRPEPMMLAKVASIMNDEAPEMGIVVVPGNHDMIDATADNGNCAVAPLLYQAELITKPSVIYLEEAGIGVFCIPFTSVTTMHDHLGKVVPSVSDYLRVVPVSAPIVIAAHVGVCGEFGKDAPNWMHLAKDFVEDCRLRQLMRGVGISLAYVGHSHERQEWSVDGYTVEQIGALCPTGFCNPGVYPSVGVLSIMRREDAGISRSITEIPGPRFIQSCEVMLKENGKKNTIYLRATSTDVLPAGVPPENVSIVDKTEMVQHGALPSVDNVDEAFIEFVARMSLPDGATAEKVLQLVHECWSVAKE